MPEAINLENNYVQLSLLTLENYQQLLSIAAEPGLVKYSPSEISTPEALRNYVETALAESARMISIPFIIYDKVVQKYAGSTRYMNIDRKNKILHIGSTWIGTEFQGSGLNTHVKNLMMDFAFDTMEMEKVEFRIDERNVRSRKAVEKLGAMLEGILRSDVYLSDGYKRNTCCYGILKAEWASRRSGHGLNLK